MLSMLHFLIFLQKCALKAQERFTTSQITTYVSSWPYSSVPWECTSYMISGKIPQCPSTYVHVTIDIYMMYYVLHNFTIVHTISSVEPHSDTEWCRRLQEQIGDESRSYVEKQVAVPKLVVRNTFLDLEAWLKLLERASSCYQLLAAKQSNGKRIHRARSASWRWQGACRHQLLHLSEQSWQLICIYIYICNLKLLGAMGHTVPFPSKAFGSYFTVLAVSCSHQNLNLITVTVV